jgi:hypothetical protein
MKVLGVPKFVVCVKRPPPVVANAYIALLRR